MRVIDPGHTYELDNLHMTSGKVTDSKSWLTFVKRVGDRYPGNKAPANTGPTTQEVLRALIDRTKYVDGQIHHAANDVVLQDLRHALYWLEKRAAEERGEAWRFRGAVEAACGPKVGAIEEMPTCRTCGHIACGRHSIE